MRRLPYKEEDFKIGRQVPGSWIVEYVFEVPPKVVGFISQGEDKRWQFKVLTAFGKPIPIHETFKTKRMAFLDFLEWCNA